MSLVVLTINNQHSPCSLSTESTQCFLWGTNWTHSVWSFVFRWCADKCYDSASRGI